MGGFRLTPEDVRCLATLAGLALPEEDVEHVAAGLEAQRALVVELLAADLAVPPALTLDPRTRA